VGQKAVYVRNKGLDDDICKQLHGTRMAGGMMIFGN
jgi:hypothetical protein